MCVLGQWRIYVCLCLRCDLFFLWRQRAVHYPVSLAGPAVRASVQCFPAQTVGKWEPQFVPQGSLISNNRPSFSSYFLHQMTKYKTPRPVDFLPCPEIQRCHQACSVRNFTSKFVTLSLWCYRLSRKSLTLCRISLGIRTTFSWKK